MKLLISSILLWLTVPHLDAAPISGMVIRVDRPLKMRARDPYPDKTYYINLGTKDGIRVGAIFQVFRELSVVDGTIGEPREFVPILIGEVEIVQTWDTSSVAQLSAMRSPAQLARLHYPLIMEGDPVQLKAMATQSEPLMGS